MLRTFLQALSISAVLLSSFFLIKSVLSLSAKDIAELSVPRYDYHSGLAMNFCHQRADTVVGFALLLFSFTTQLINMLWPMRINDFAINKAGVCIAIIVAILLFFIAQRISDFLYAKSFSQVEALLKK
jgi:cobalamin synthase